MTIKTLQVIHKLLIENAQRATAEYRAARALQHEYEERENPDKELIANQTAAADELMNVHIKASNALEDFEAQEW